jgi:hypothetical protein
MNKNNIERNARNLQIDIWKQRNELWSDGHPPLTRMFSPEVAARVLGLNYQEVESLGRFGDKSGKFEVAGVIDPSRKSISISNRFTVETMRFTGGHEIGHWLLHPRETMHRDRPIEGLSTNTYKKSSMEAEADHFAACFLMPRRLVKNCLQKTFQITAPFEINDVTAFHLCSSDPNSILREGTGSLNTAAVIASATSFGTMHFNSLAQQFGVSVSTMAIRLRELELIRD